MNIIDQNAGAITSNSLDELVNAGGTATKRILTLVGHNMGNNTLLISVPMHEFYEISEVANERGLESRKEFAAMEIAQRKLDSVHAAKLALYVLKGLLNAVAVRYRKNGKEAPPKLSAMQKKLGEQPYLSIQPITANLRSCGFGGQGLRVERSPGGQVFVLLAEKDVLWVVDGQHRRYAMQLVFEFLRVVQQSHRYPKRPALFPSDDGEMPSDELKLWSEAFELARTACSVMVEVHLGLDPDQERQLFHDLNNLTKKVEASLAFQFDNSNPVNLFIKTELIQNGLLKAHVEEKDVTDWRVDKGVISRKDLIAVNALLFLNKTNISGAKPQQVAEKEEIGQRFWAAVSEIDGFGEENAKRRTVAAQPVVLKALAKLVYDFGFGRHQSAMNLEKLLDGIPKLNLSHSDPMWRYYELSPEQRASKGLSGLADYLPPDDTGANRDIGGFDPNEQVMRFGAKHNDIYPIIGDMVRWRLGLPSRHEKALAA